MVRVNHPPGGVTHLHSEGSTESKTVRILKPPGGESSISFTEPEGELANGSVDTSAPLSAQEAVENGSVDNSVSSVQEELENGLAPAIIEVAEVPEVVKPENLESETTLVNESTSSDVPKQESRPETKEEDTPKSCDNANLKGETISEQMVVKDTVEAEEKENLVVEEVDTASSAHSNQEFPSTVPEDSNQNSSSTAVPESKESSRAPLPVLRIEKREVPGGASEDNINKVPDISTGQSSRESTPTSKSPLTKAPPTSPLANQDTRDRLGFGEPPAILANRPVRIRDHLKSTIFGSDDDYYSSTRFSREPANSSVPDSTKQPISGQRGRVPPGGFSTKLW